MVADLYELNTAPPLGVVPRRMYASLIRPKRYGKPIDAFKTEVVETPAVGPRQVVIRVMAAGLNYNNIWAAEGRPLDVITARRKAGAVEDFHIGGSDASGIIWAVGPEARGVEIGDEVVVLPNRWDEHAQDIRLGADPATSASQSIWGYEDNWGSFAQYALVEDYQCHPRPQRLSWTEAAVYTATAATAYRQLFGWAPHTVRPGDPVLVWGGAGGIGSMAIQLARWAGGRPVAVVSDSKRGEYCMALGAAGWIDRRDFEHWGRLPDINDSKAMDTWFFGARAFGRRFWQELGERRAPRIVVEHSGAATIPTSMYVCDTSGMVVTCGATSGYNGDLDLRILWMRQKRLQGSHCANTYEARAVTTLVEQGALDSCLSLVMELDEVGRAHQMMQNNEHPPGNIAIRVGALR